MRAARMGPRALALAAVAVAACLLPGLVSASSDVTLKAVGSTFGESLYRAAAIAYQVETAAATQVHVDYAGLNSVAGNCRIKDPQTCATANKGTATTQVDWAGTDLELSSDELSAYSDVQMYPTAAGAVAVIYNVEGFTNFDAPIVFSRSTLVKIWTGQITKWNDPAIIMENRQIDIRLPDAPIQLVTRADDSGTEAIFKRALGKFHPDFDASWTANKGWNPALGLVKRVGNVGVAKYVQTTTNSMSFAVFGVAKDMEVPYGAILQEDGSSVAPSADTVQFAVLEKGLVFDPPAERLTVDFTDTKGSKAYPISAFTYAAIRKNDLDDRIRTGGSCATVRQTMEFFTWFYQSKTVEDIAATEGYAPLPELVREKVLQRLGSDILCEGMKLFLETTVTLNMKGNTLAGIIVEDLIPAYSAAAPSVDLKFSGVATSSQLDFGPTPAEYVHFTEGLPSKAADFTHNPFFGFAIGVAFNLPGVGSLKLDLPTLAKILDGEVTTWNDAAIASLNSGVVLPANPIIILDMLGQDDTTDVVKEILTKVKTNFDFTGADASTHRFNTYTQVKSHLTETQYTIALLPLLEVESFDTFTFADIKSGNAFVAPTTDAVASCMKAAVGSDLALDWSAGGASCYPLTRTIHVVYHSTWPKARCASTKTAPYAAMNFLEWLFLDPNVRTNLLKRNAVMFEDTQAMNDKMFEKLNSVTCDGDSILFKGCPPGSGYSVEKRRCYGCPSGEYNINADSLCRLCPIGAVCNGGTGISLLTDFWADPSTFGGDIRVYRCRPEWCCKEARCPLFSNGTVCSSPELDSNVLSKAFEEDTCSDLTCAENKAGPLCGQCEDPFILVGNKSSENCTEASAGALIVLFLICSLGVMAFLSLIHGDSNWSEVPVTERSIKVLANFFNILQLIEFNATGVISRLFSLNSYTVIEMTDECLWNTDPIGNMVMSAFLPITMMVSLGLMVVLEAVYQYTSILNFLQPTVRSILGWWRGYMQSQAKRTSMAENPSRKWWWKYMYVFSQLLIFCHATIMITVFRLFQCREVNGVKYLSYSPGVECFEGNHQTFVGIGIALLVIYILPLPFFSAMLAHLIFKGLGEQDQNKRAAAPPTKRQSRLSFRGSFLAIRNQPGFREFEKIYGAFWIGYKEDYYWYEAWNITRRIIIIGIFVLLDTPQIREEQDELYSKSFVSGFCLLTAIIHFSFRPFQHEVDNHCEGFLLLAIAVVPMADYARTISNEQDMEKYEALEASVIYVPVFICVMVYTVRYFYHTYKK